MASVDPTPASSTPGGSRLRGMSSIDKLMIQGIRSFGAKDEQKAVIQFGTPLTLITGQNGAGKTTIIECLRYITTGEFPPNSKGGAFVHDPKLVGEREVRGVVKLKFRDITSNTVVCHRMLQSTQKPRKIEQKTLDSSLEKFLPSGEKKKITSRCSEIDREMISHLGVSKPILNHVIFCHQEDSTWPLSEGKALKSKFDDIFASTRCTKALENIKKFQHEQVNECKVYGAELQYLSKQKEKVEELKGNQRDAQKKLDATKADITRVRNELEPVEIRLQKLNDLSDQVTSLQTTIAELNSSKKELLKSQEGLRAKIEHLFTGSLSELQQQYDDHHSHVERSERSLNDLERKQKRVIDETESLKSELTSCYKEHGRLKTEDQYHQQRVVNRDKRITNLATQLKIEGIGESPFAQNTVKKFLSQVSKLRQQMEDKGRQEKQTCLDKEHSLQEQINELRTNLAQLEQSKTMKVKAVEENKQKIGEIGRNLASIRSGEAALDGVEQDLRTAEQELADYHAQVDIPSLDSALVATKEEKRKIDEKVILLQKELSRVSQQSTARGALDALRKQKRAKEEDFQNEMAALEADMLSVLGYMPAAEEDLEKKLAEFERKKSEEKKRVLKQYQEASSKLSRFQTIKEEKVKQLSHKKERMQALQDEVSDVCAGSSGTYEEIVKDLEDEIERKNEQFAALKGSQSFFKLSLQKVHSSRKCPLCVRGFDDEDSFEKTIKSITTRLNESIPRMLPQLSETLQQLNDKQKRLQALQPKIEELSSLRSEEIPRLEKAVEEHKTSITKIQSVLSKAEREQTSVSAEIEQIRALLPKVSRVSQCRELLKELDQKISVEEAKFRGHGDTTRSQHMISKELQEAQRTVDELNRKMDHKRQEITDCQNTIRELEKAVHSHKEEKLRLQSQQQQREVLVSKKSELAAQTDTLEREIKTLSNQLGPVREKMSRVEQEKEQISQEREEAEAVSRTEVQGIREKEDAIRKNTDEITRYISGGSDKAMKDCEYRLGDLSARQQTLDTEKKELEEQISQVYKQSANAKVRELELLDNLQFLRQQGEIEEKDKEIKKCKEKLRSMGLDKFEDEYARLQREADRLRTEEAHCNGNKKSHEDIIRHIQRELQSDMYKDTEARHRDVMGKLKTTEIANQDLGKYYKALDRAIMRYHSLKMQEINKIIKELWIKTYRGGDIDTIEIRSEDNEEGASIGARRTYNYRVVMLKGDTVLDMRGRCSAGQKVLASIIIRLALAETFCLNSGLLALDEPTTNLDRDNVEGLAQALADIVRERSKNQKNFQLIIITHDEAFVELLGHTGYADCYFKVSKGVGECSMIARKFFAGP